ncbi:MAG: S-adenosylmethionine decarboxylase [Candidatus Moranbacteria bacterium]|nr:S-adenosylmethionine decarboxylase [Candidatus Moranbacteria bacterium]
MANDQEILEKYEKENPWGMLTSIDLKECNPEIIRNAEKIKDFVAKLCDLIGMKRFGEIQVVHFGENQRVAGFSMTQLIETSLISGHFANQSNAVYLDIFSCGKYPPYKSAEFCKDFFQAKSAKVTVIFRH